MISAPSTLHVTGLAKEKLHAPACKQRLAGMPLRFMRGGSSKREFPSSSEPRTLTFDDLFAPAQERFRKSGMTEQELDKLVNVARTRHNRRTSRKKA